MNKNIIKVLSSIFLLIILTFLVCCNAGDKNKNNNNTSDPKTNKLNYCDTVKPTGKIIDTKKIKPIDSLQRITTKNLNDIKRYGAGSFIVAGDSGTIMITPNGGLNWVQPATGTTKHLYGSVINDYDTMMVVGEGGLILRSNNKGVTWNIINPGTTKTLRSVCFPTKFTGYSSGDSGIVIKTTNAGLNWSTVISSDTMGTIRSIYFADTLTGWFCTSKGKIYKTFDGGSNWTGIFSDNTLVLNSLSFNGNTRGTVVGNNGKILTSTDGGVTWTVYTDASGYNFYGVHRVNDKLAYICGQSKILREDNGSYTELINNPAYKFNSVDPHPYIYGLAAADLGLICGVTVNSCDCINQNNLVMMPTEENHKWRISIRLNNDANYKKFLRIFTPGYQVDNNVITGWTQNDQINTNNELTYDITQSNPIGTSSSQTGSFTVTGINDVITVNLEARTSALINIYLGPNGLNTFPAGSVNFYYGQSEFDYCAHVKYELEVNP